MSGLTIKIVGPRLRACTVGALLARHCVPSGASVAILADAEPRHGAHELLRPTFHRFHAEVGITAADLDRIGVRPVTTTRVAGCGIAGEVSLPFGPFGFPRDGADFHQHWLRSKSLGSPHDISAYSPSLMLSRLAGSMSCEQTESLPVETGMIGKADAYTDLLKARAEALGATFAQPGPENPADLIFDCGELDAPSQWQAGRITVANPSRIPGTGLHACLQAVNRWLAFSARPGTSTAEAREFNRLSGAEAERIADMVELLFAADPASSPRQALRRKIDVFEACGRIPSEDYEVFASHEWLAALLARGFYPARHDRLADALPQGELLDWLERMRRQLAPRGKAA